MASRGRRPEHGGPPELFYDETEARKYVRNSRMIDIQTRMAGRALELLYLPENKPCYLLDIGCGTGLSGSYLSDEGHYWVGLDISPAMLDEAVDREIEGDLLLGDMGQGIPFKPGTFDGCIRSGDPELSCSCTLRTQSSWS
ncbi:BUD23 rRNA methyltransferase and ribosome maturation factor [Homo sapiens]|nr:BUD23 rRNA methyltransferase and ribosome maturation factor [Homo sapiens]KAI4014103.1 BUD23 rRNA methyltransferase and ribosome maturation factor [Homo sapiens]